MLYAAMLPRHHAAEAITPPAAWFDAILCGGVVVGHSRRRDAARHAADAMPMRYFHYRDRGSRRRCFHYCCLHAAATILSLMIRFDAISFVFALLRFEREIFFMLLFIITLRFDTPFSLFRCRFDVSHSLILHFRFASMPVDAMAASMLRR